jgi:hypothetical protein
MIIDARACVVLQDHFERITAGSEFALRPGISPLAARTLSGISATLRGLSACSDWKREQHG